MIQYCFPTIYWHFKVGKIELDDLIDSCVSNNEWSCNVKTSRGVEYNWDGFLTHISPYFLQLPYKKKGSIKFDTPWMNVYTNGCYQEPHHHVSSGNQLSYCYFLKLPVNSGKFGFMNENYRNYCLNDFNDFIDIDQPEWGYPDVKEGDLLIFPSFLIHQVTYQAVNKCRVTISGNLKIGQVIE